MQPFVQRVPQKVINLGYKLAAKFLGTPFLHYRPTTPTPVLVPINVVETVNLAFDQDPSFGHQKPKGFADLMYYGLVDLTFSQVGDYFSDGDNTFFVANIEPLRPSLLVKCNRMVKIMTPTANSAVSNGYGGDTSPITKLEGWPAAILDAGIGGPNINKTPGTVNDDGVILYLPNFAPLNYADIVIDDLDRRYVVGQSELTSLGYKALMRLEVP